jgi:glycosyltransferase involved in cell wall biosynthesis
LNRKHILFLTNWFPTKENPSFGIFVKRHAEAISQNFNITVVHLNFERGRGIFHLSLEKLDSSVKGYQLNFSGAFYRILYYMPALVTWYLNRKLRKIHLANKFDLIISNVIFNSGIVGHYLSKKLNIKQVHIEHWSGIQNFLRKNILCKRALNALINMESVIVVSKQLNETINQINKNINVQIVPNVISNYFVYNEQFINEHELSFLAVANWKYPKRLDLLLDGLTSFQTENPEISFVLKLIGQGPLISDQLLRDLPFKVERIPIIDNIDLPKMYNQSDFLLHFSDFETFSIVPLEALACGCPVIGSRVGVLPEFINEKNGRLVENDVKSISYAIKESIHSKYSRKDISNQIINLFSKDIVAAKFRQILQDF